MLVALCAVLFLLPVLQLVLPAQRSAAPQAAAAQLAPRWPGSVEDDAAAGGMRRAISALGSSQRSCTRTRGVN